MSENLAVGFAEAAQAFSDEVASTSNCSDLAGNLVSGYLKANARFLEELANTSRRMTEEFTTQRWPGVQSDADIGRLADIVAARIAATQPQAERCAGDRLRPARRPGRGEAGRQAASLNYDRFHPSRDYSSVLRISDLDGSAGHFVAPTVSQAS